MYLDKYFKKTGYYHESQIYYEDIIDFICTGILGFCGCGRPIDALIYIRDVLSLIDEWTGHEFQKITYEEHKEKEKALFNNEGQAYFTWYYLDNLGLTDHGGSVPGWLTPEGEILLSDLKELDLENYDW